MSNSSPERIPVEQLAEEFLERHRRGEKPSISEYTDKYPDLAAEINDLFPALVMMEELKPVSESPNGPATATAAGSEHGALATGASTGTSTTTRKKLERLGDYRILREVGRGGMGIVYEAEQISLGRRVALKVLPSQALLDPRQQQRFQREAKAAARLHHTNIVPVFGVGDHDGLHYYVMQFINGLGLDEVLVELKRLRKARSASKGEGSGARGQGSGSKPQVTHRQPEIVPGPTLPAAEVAQALMTGQFNVSAPRRAPDPAATTPEEPKVKDIEALSHRAHREHRENQRSVNSVSSVAPSSSTPDAGSSTSHPRSSILDPRSSILDPRSSTESGRHYWQSVARIGVQVADALDYAHGQGIFHRDIKPSNLLLDNQGTVWVTDFGLAKASADGENLTHTGDILGTLRYMAPERFKGQSDARCDIYSLGLTLYELLVQRPAFDETDRNKLIHQVTHEEPVRPRKSNPAIPRDLETIVLKSIEREPDRRYPTARALGEDLKRFVEDKPIRARQVSNSERLLRWCRRNPALAGSMAGIAALLVIGFVASTIAAFRFSTLAKRETIARKDAETAQRDAEKAQADAEAAQKSEAEQHRQAEANLTKARAAVDYFTGVAENDMLKIPGALALRHQVLQKAKTYYEDFLKDRRDDPALQTELAATYLRMGRISYDLGQYVEVREIFKKAIGGYESAASRDPKNADIQDRLADAWQVLGDVDYTEKHIPAAFDPWNKATRIREALVQAHPNNSNFKEKLATVYNRLGIAQNTKGQQGDALESYRKCLEIRLELVRDNPNSPTLQYGLGESFLNLGQMLSQKGYYDEALAMVLRSRDSYRAACAQMPHMVEYALDLGSTYNLAGNLLYWNLGQQEQGFDQYQQRIDHFLAKVRAYPEVPIYRAALADHFPYHLHKYLEKDRKKQALSLLREASEAIANISEPTGDDFYFLAGLQGRSAALIGFGKEKLTTDERAQERRELEQVSATFAHAVAAGFKDYVRVKNDLTALQNDPIFKGLKERNKEWFAAFDKEIQTGPTINHFNELAGKKPENDTPSLSEKARPTTVTGPKLTKSDVARSKVAIGLLKGGLGQHKESTQALAEALAIRQELLKTDPKNTQYQEDLASSYMAQGHLDWQAGRLADAVGHWQQGLDGFTSAVASGVNNDPGTKSQNPLRFSRLASEELAIGRRYAEVGLWSDAAEHFRKSFAKQLSGDGNQWNEYAFVLSLNGDKEKYQQTCSQLLQQFGDTPMTWLASDISRAVLVGSPPSTEVARCLEMAQRGLAAEPQAGWRLVRVSLALYRAGRSQEALQQLKQHPHYAEIWPLRALVHHQLGQPREAKHWLQKADDWSRQSIQAALTRNAVQKPFLINWWDWAAFQILRREAHELVHDMPQGEKASRERQRPELTPDDPWQHLLRAHTYFKLGLREKADREFQSAVAVNPKDPEIWIACAKLFAQLGQFDQAEANFIKAIEAKPDDCRPWIARGRFFAERGQSKKADADFTKAAALTPNDLNKFIEAGWWVIGPYPEDLQISCPPEKEPDPSRPVTLVVARPESSKGVVSGVKQRRGRDNGVQAQNTPFDESGRATHPDSGRATQPVPWKPAPTDTFGRVELRTMFDFDGVSSYALAYVYSTEERTATIMVGGDDHVRVWLNGRLVHEIPDRLILWPWGLDRVPVTLHAGRNTILVKISNLGGAYGFHLRMSDYPVDHAFDFAQLSLWKEAADQFAKMPEEEILADSHLWRHYALYLLLSGDVDAYRAFRARIWERFSESPEPGNKGALVLSFNLMQDPAVDWSRLVQMAEDWVAEPNQNEFWRKVQLGVTYFRAGKFDKAVEILSKSGAAGFGFVPVLAMAHHRLGHEKEAQQRLTRTEKQYDGYTSQMLAKEQYQIPWWRDNFAQFLIFGPEAKIMIEGEASKSYPNLEPLQAKARKWLEGRDKATADYDLAVLLQPNQARFWMARARRCAELQRWDQADADLVKALELQKLKPTDPKYWTERGRFYTDTGQPDKAGVDFARAKELGPPSTAPK